MKHIKTIIEQMNVEVMVFLKQIYEFDPVSFYGFIGLILCVCFIIFLHLWEYYEDHVKPRRKP